MTAPAPLRDVVVVGGGCYGTFYAGQLAKARARGKVAYRRVLVVDHDPDCRARRELGEEPGREFVQAEWSAYLDEHLGHKAATPAADIDDVIVPSPHMPHLLFEWLVRRARARWPDRRIGVVAVPDSLATPYDRAVADGTRYVSFADWICPTHCIEPATCPAIGAPRTWEMGDAVRSRLGSGVVLLASAADGQARFIVTVDEALTKRGLHAGKIAATVGARLGGKGGGRPDSAQGGGKETGALRDALAAAREVIASQVG